MSWVEEVLREWGGWLRAKGDGQGWGGSLDLDRLFELAQSRRHDGEHSDPVAAEVAATHADGQTPHQRVNRYVMLCNPELRMTATLRYAGIREPLDEPEPRAQMRYVAGRLEYGDAPTDFEMIGGYVWFRDTPGLAVAAVASLMGVAPDTVYARLDRLHDTIRAELIQEAKIRKTQRAARREAA